MKKIKELFLKYKEIILYIIVGGLTTFVRWGTTAILEPTFYSFGIRSTSLDFLTTLTSLVITILFAYPPNKLFVFESKSFKAPIVAKEFAAFLSARAVASIIELAGIPLMCRFLHLPNLAATMIVSVVVLVANYIFSKLVVFKKRPTEKNKQPKQKENSKADVVINLTRKDKVIATILIIICTIIALISLSALGVKFFNLAITFINGK